MRFLITLILFFSILGSTLAQEARIQNNLEQIKWITEPYPPFSYIDDKDNKLKGIMIDILVEIWKEAGLKKERKDIDIYPWARGVYLLENDPLVCLFGMGITKKRREKYKFVSPFSPGVYGLIAKKSKNYHFNSFNELNKKFKDKGRVIGVIRNGYGSKIFVEHGGNPDLLYNVSVGDGLVRMLAMDRLEVISFGELSTIANMKKEKIDYKEYEIVLVSKKIISGYAFNNKVDPLVLNTLQAAFDKIVKKGITNSILNNYIDHLDRSAMD